VRALVIPVEGPLYEIELTNDVDRDLAVLQEAVGGHIEGVPLPSFIGGHERAIAYVNEDGKFYAKPNMRATDFMVPGVGLHVGDYIAGNLVLCGANVRTGDHAELPAPVVARARLIEEEAGS
jgi:uncharacterized protein DUF3846